MYNEKQKRRYLDYCAGVYDENTITNIESKFSVCEWIEIEKQKDISLFTKYEIDEYLYSIGIKSTPGSLAAIVSYYSKYTAWCIDNALTPTGINHFEEIVGEGKFDKYINKRVQRLKYITPDELNTIVSALENPRDQFVMVALYEIGVSSDQEDLMSIKIGDIDQANNTVKLISGRCPVVSNNFIEYAKSAAEETEYYTKTYSGPRVFQFDPSPYVYKNLDRINLGSTGGSSRIFRTLRQIKKVSGMNDSVTANTISDSGLFFFIKKESEKLGISEDEFINQYADVIENQYNKTIERTKLIYKRLKDLF